MFNKYAYVDDMFRLKNTEKGTLEILAIVRWYLFLFGKKIEEIRTFPKKKTHHATVIKIITLMLCQ